MRQADLGLNLTTKRTRKLKFLAQMECVLPWAALVELIAPNAPEGKKGRPPFPVETVLRIKANVRANAEHPFGVLKRQFGHVKVRYGGLKENTAQLMTLFALSNLWMVGKRLSVLGVTQSDLP